MLYTTTALQIYIPSAPLSDYVQMFWYWEGYHPPHPKERILPHGTMELVMNLADEPLYISYPEDGFTVQCFDSPIVSGARSKYFVIDTQQPASILAVWFKFGGAFPFFNAGGHELRNLHVPLDAFWGQQAHDIYHQLLDAPSTLVRFHLLEDALTTRLMTSADRHPAVNYALRLFARDPQNMNIGQVVDKIALSPTRFIQVFREDIGLTPKLFTRIRRFQEALKVIANSPNLQTINWADIALTCGYFDQSHLINDFRAFAGISPTLYAPQDPAHNSNIAYLG